MSMFMRGGSWGYSSKKDPRWNISGRCVAAFGFGEIPEARDALLALKARLGEPPADLEYWYMKD